jgi:membrane protein YqaA with SNARE-associated domain
LVKHDRVGARAAVLTMGGVLALAGLVAVAAPGERGLAWLMLYTIPSHAFISPFPHEPVLLYYSKIYSPWACATASMLGCLAAAVLDYAFVLPLIHHPRIRRRYERARLYQRLLALFRRQPFWALVVAGLTPIPFYPIKFLSLASDYPLRSYLAALVVGRFPRYLALAWFGYVVQPPNWSLVLLALLFLVLGANEERRERRREAAARGVEEVSDRHGAEPGA